jgi:hypothetical protein
MIELGHESEHTLSFIDSLHSTGFYSFFSVTSRESFISLLREETKVTVHNKTLLCVSRFVKFHVTRTDFIPLFRKNCSKSNPFM